MKTLVSLFCFFVSLHVYGQSTIKRVTVKFRPTVTYSIDHSQNTFSLEDKTAEDILSANGLFQIMALLDHNKRASALKSIDLIKDIHFLKFRTSKLMAAIIAELQSTRLFEYVEEDFTGTSGGATSVTPNDTYFYRQWGFSNNGTFNAQATAGADVKMPDAWSKTTGNTGTIVCVLDAGLKLDHPEFAGRIWVNAGEIANNDIDDDGNGYTDDVNGWDWAYADNNPTDDFGHGTNVTGIIGANANNNAGYAGVNWNCKLMIGKILNSANSGFYSWWTSGIYYAVAEGAKVINMSVGGTSFSQSMKDACDFAYNNNVTILACMMNTNNNVANYPAAYSSTIAVGATTVNDYRASPFAWGGGSNYGPHIDVVAPGNYIYGLAYNSDINYNTSWSGTSQATPLVAGIVSLMYGLKPSLTVSEVRNILQTTATDMVGNPVEDVAGFDQYMGYGRVNASTALFSSILPLNMGSLTGHLKEKKVHLTWQTFEEINIKQFEIERSVNLLDWNKVGVLISRGNSNITQMYSFMTDAVGNETNFYRLKIVENDLSFFYSNICIIKPVVKPVIKLVSPVVNDEIKLNVLFNKTVKVQVDIYSMNGAILLRNNLTIAPGNSLLSVNTNHLPAGQYVIIIDNDRGEILLSEKVIKLK
jgi:hypothetical protein